MSDQNQDTMVAQLRVAPALHSASTKVTFLKSVWNWQGLALIKSCTWVRKEGKFLLLPSNSVG
jgi:hypothetical protein